MWLRTSRVFPRCRDWLGEFLAAIYRQVSVDQLRKPTPQNGGQRGRFLYQGVGRLGAAPAKKGSTDADLGGGQVALSRCFWRTTTGLPICHLRSFADGGSVHVPGFGAVLRVVLFMNQA